MNSRFQYLPAVKKILHAYKVFHPDSFGGIPEVLHQIISAIRPSIAHHLLVTRGKFGFARRAHAPGLTIEYLCSAGMVVGQPISPHYPFRLWFAAWRAKLLVCHLPFLWADLAVLGFLPRRLPLVLHWHANIAEEMKIFPLLQPLLDHTLRRAQKIIVSDESLINHSKLLNGHRDKCEIIPLGIDVDKWGKISPSDQLRIDQLRQNFPRMVVSVGRLVSYKGYDVLIRAMLEVDAQLFIIGEGPEYAALNNLIAALNLGHKVQLLGRCSDEVVRDYLHAAKVFAFSSVTVAESFGIAQLEAMACGCPIVNTNLASAVPNVARHGQEALTVAPSDAHGLADSMTKLLNDPELAERLRQNGARRVREIYTTERFVEKTYAVYDALMTGVSR